MNAVKKIFPFIFCINLVSCAHTPEPTNLKQSANTPAAIPAAIKPANAAEKPAQAPTLIINEAEFPACVIALSQKARAAGISEKTITGSLATAKFNAQVIELDRQQPEFTTSFADYLNRRVTDQRVAQGQALLAQHKVLLNRVEKEYGVPAPYLLAFWGLETNYGSFFGKLSIVNSLATLACDHRRSDYFTGELIAALRILDEGAIAPDKMVGSWAGAMGNLQFMPTAFLQHAVDYDGDHKRDLWNSTPDAMASAAKYLQSLGWRSNERWGREVKLPSGFPFLEAGLRNNKTMSEWRKLGVTRANNKPLPLTSDKASLLVPAGYQGPAFLVYGNFDAIMHWNRSEFYALAVGILADRIAGEGKLVQPPPDAPRLRYDQVITLQDQLNQKGFNAGIPDGILGPGTRRAIGEFQHQQGMIADGFPSKKVVEMLGVSLAP